MKKQFIALSLLILGGFFTEAQAVVFDNISDEPLKKCTVPKTAKTDRELNCLKGAVRMVKTEKVRLVKKGEQVIRGEMLLETSAAYDRSGRITESVFYNFKGGVKTLSNRIVYSYDAKGVLIGWEEYVGANSVPTKTVYMIDAQGRKLKEITTYPDSGRQEITAYIYDADGNPLEKRNYSLDKDEAYNEAKPSRSTHYKYKDSKQIEAVRYDKKGTAVDKTEFAYDTGGNRTQIIESYSEGDKYIRSSRISQKYDAQGNLLEKLITNNNDSIQLKTVYDYDAKGYKVSEIAYDAAGKITQNGAFKFTFDQQGNWTTYRSTKNGASYEGEFRTIAYY